MNYISFTFYVFCIFYFFIFFCVPIKYRYLVILLGSYFFYGFGNANVLVFLLITTGITYLGGLLLQKYPKKQLLIPLFLLNISLLIVFKYTNFIIQNLNMVSSRFLSGAFYFDEKNLILPIGLSFYIFQSCTYLTDVYKHKIEAEKNILLYASFVSFFPTILSGPIQKARELLPQIKSPRAFDSVEAKKGTLLFIWGLFEKIMVSNNLLMVVNKIYSDYVNYNGVYYIIAAICFSLYIYADFSSYSDMARGISKIMGINIGKNFDNPYLSLSTSEFWNRWHRSLNQWFIENIYIPLGGNRKGKFRKYVNVMIVFLVSGLWHGSNWHFVAWGLINGLLVVVGQITKPLRKAIYNKLNVDETLESIVFIRRATVFVMISLTWIFFQNGIRDSLSIIKGFTQLKLINFFDASLLSLAGTTTTTLIIILMTVIFCIVQCKRQRETFYFERFEKQPVIFQSVLCAVIIIVCVFSMCSPNAQVNTQFLYFQF